MLTTSERVINPNFVIGLVNIPSPLASLLILYDNNKFLVTDPVSIAYSMSSAALLKNINYWLYPFIDSLSCKLHK